MDEPIMISVIIPTYNRCQLLKECLESLGRQTYPLSDIEVMVVNDGSTDGTEAFLEDFKTRAPFQFRYFRQQNKGPAAARNLALQNAKGNLIAFTDDDCTVDPDWLKEFAKGFQEKRIAGYGGAVRPKEDHLIGEYMTRERSLEPKEIDGRIVYLVTCNACYRKEVLLKVRGFDETIRYPGGEDPDLSFRILEQGYELKYNPRSIVYHSYERSLGNFMKRYYNYGIGGKYTFRVWGNKYLSPPKSRETLLLNILKGALTFAAAFRDHLRARLGLKKATAFTFLSFLKHFSFFCGFRFGRIADKEGKEA